MGLKGKLKEKNATFWEYLQDHARSINESKIFAGCMIIIINIASKFVTFKVSKTMESYLKYNFSRDILVFAITWMGTRDIFIAIGMTLLFMLLADYIFNENSMFCCLSKSTVSQQISKLNEPVKIPSQEDIIKAKMLLDRVGQGQPDLADAQMNPGAYRESFSNMMS